MRERLRSGVPSKAAFDGSLLRAGSRDQRPEKFGLVFVAVPGAVVCARAGTEQNEKNPTATVKYKGERFMWATAVPVRPANHGDAG